MKDNGKTYDELLLELHEAKREIEAQKLELSEYKDRFELIMTSANLAWWEMDVPTGKVTFSKKKAEMLGYSPDKFSHYKDFMSLVHPADYDSTMQKMMDHFHGKVPNYDACYRIQTSTGEYKLFHDIGRITKYDVNNKPITVSGIVIDGVDTLKLDEVRHESDVRFKYMFQDNKSIMLLIDPISGKIFDANKSAVNFYNYSIDELRNMSIDNINILSHKQIFSERAKAVKSEQNIFIFPHRLSNGEIRQVEVHTSPIEFNNQQLLFSIIDDVTERLRLEDKLKKSEEELKKAEKIGKFGNWQFYVNENLMTYSEGARIIYGLDGNEIMVEKIQRQVLPEYRPVLDNAIFNLLNNGLSFEVEYKIKRESDGNLIYIHSVAEYDSVRNIVFGTIQDISEQKNVEEELRLSEEKFRSLYTNMSEGSAMHTLIYNQEGVPEDYRIIEVNPAFETQLKISRESVIYKTSKEAYGVDVPPYFEIYSRVALTGKPEVFETYFAPLDKYFSISVYCPNKGCFATIFENITDRKKAEHDLQIILSKYQILFDIFPIGITISDSTGKIIESNQIAETFLGISLKEQEKRNINGQEWKIIRSDGTIMPASEFASVRALEESKQISNVEMGILKDNEQITWLNVSAIPMPIEGYGVAIVYGDITEHKQAEEALKKSEEKYRFLAENISDVIWILNLTQGKFTYISPSVFQMRGFTVEEAMAQDISESLTHESAQKVLSNISIRIKEFQKNGTLGTLVDELQQPCKDGSIKWIETVTKYQYAKDGSIEVFGVSRDITERKQAEIKIQQQNMELVKLNADKDRFISILAHDLKSPFNSLLGFSELLIENIRQYDIEKIETQLSYIYISEQNIYALLDDLLMWARSQSGRLQFEPKECDLAKLNSDIIQILSPNANAKKIIINQNGINDIIVYADSNMLKTILRNLISNAIKYTHCEGTIDISATKSSSEITISVSDNGVGIAPEILIKLFDITQIQTNCGTSGEKGTGLGLLLCKDFVEKHGGRIWVESQLEHGSTFYFTLPHCRADNNL